MALDSSVCSKAYYASNFSCSSFDNLGLEAEKIDDRPCSPHIPA